MNKVKRPKYRNTFEKEVAKQLKTLSIPFDYERDILYYYVKKSYKGDFFIFDDLIIEAKGYFRGSDRSKMKHLKEQHPEIDFRFLFQSNNKISPKSKTRYSDWCEKNGFKYAIGTIPKEWQKEIRKRLRNS